MQIQSIVAIASMFTGGGLALVTTFNEFIPQGWRFPLFVVGIVLLIVGATAFTPVLYMKVFPGQRVPTTVEHIPLEDVVSYILTRNWKAGPTDWQGDEGSARINRVHKAMNEIERHAAAGDLIVYGTSPHRKDGPPLPLPPEYWRSHGLDILCLFDGDAGALRTENKVPGSTRSEPYVYLSASKEKVGLLWPEGKRAARLRR